MDDARAVRFSQPCSHLRGNVDRVVQRQRPASDPLLERFPVVMGHHEVELGVLRFVDLVDRADVGMVEGRCRLRLLEESLLRGVVAGQIRR